MEKILSEETPLLFQWLPVKFGDTIPNNEKYPYLQRLVNWAEREPQRTIYLVVEGSGLREEQITALEEALAPLSNIKVVDFHKMELGTSEKIKGLTPIELFECRYSDNLKDNSVASHLKEINFGDFLDFMRLFILQYRENFTGNQEAIIYMDFDILPSEDGKKIGPVDMLGFILMADGGKNKTYAATGPLEKSIIAVNHSSEKILSEMIAESTKVFNDSPPQWLQGQTIFGIMGGTVKNKIKKFDKSENPELSNVKSYQFSGMVEIHNDHSWQYLEHFQTSDGLATKLRDLYEKTDLSILYSANSIKQAQPSCSATLQALSSVSTNLGNLACTQGDDNNTAYSGLEQLPGNIPKA